MINKYLLISIITFGATFFYGCGESKIEKEKKIVNTGIVKNYPQTTIGRAFEAAFDNANWTWHEKNGKTYLCFTGKVSKKLHDYAVLNIQQNDFDEIDLHYGLFEQANKLLEQANKKYLDQKTKRALDFSTKHSKILNHLFGIRSSLTREIQNNQNQFKIILRKQYKVVKAEIDKVRSLKKTQSRSVYRKRKKEELKSIFQLISNVNSSSYFDPINGWLLKDRAPGKDRGKRLFIESPDPSLDKINNTYEVESGSEYTAVRLAISDNSQVIETINKNPKLKEIKDKIIEGIASIKFVDFVACSLNGIGVSSLSLENFKILQVKMESFYKKTKNEKLYKKIKDILENLELLVKEKDTVYYINDDDWGKARLKIYEKYKKEFWKFNSNVTFEFLLYADRKTFELVKFNNDSWYKFKLSSVAVMNVIYSL